MAQSCRNVTNVFAKTLIETNHSDRIYFVSNSRACEIAIPAWKRALDIVCIIVALPGVLLFAALIAVLIKAVSRGPVLLNQERVGLGCHRFGCWKFRTMHMGADKNVHQQHLANLLRDNTPMVKMDSSGDPRLIRFGAILRASGLDELPQLINVLRGEMSLVGPRPCLPYEFELYKPWQRERFNTLPGLTGLWQVRGKNKTTFTEMIALDIQYVRTKSLRLDAQILAATLGTLVSQLRAVRRVPLPTEVTPQRMLNDRRHLPRLKDRRPEPTI